jgi:hypothetical protein
MPTGRGLAELELVCPVHEIAEFSKAKRSWVEVWHQVLEPTVRRLPRRSSMLSSDSTFEERHGRSCRLQRLVGRRGGSARLLFRPGKNVLGVDEPLAGQAETFGRSSARRR